MDIKSFGDLSDIHMGILSEIGNIGSGNAATSLSMMLGQQVGIAIPDVGVANYDEAYEKLGGADAVMVGMVLMLSGDMSGMIMFLVPCDVACTLINMIAYTDYKDCMEIDEMGFSAISELANIMSAA